MAEHPIKNGTYENDRIFITHKGLSLIEIISHDDVGAFVLFDTVIKKQYSYFDEEYTLAFLINNVDHFNLKPFDVLDMAFEWFREYMIWEDTGH